MKRRNRFLLFLLLFAFAFPLHAEEPAAPAAEPAEEEEDSPHRMLLPDGEADQEKCETCHTESMDLSASKLETCTLCHAETLHSGSIEHLRIPAERVKALLPEPGEGVPELPLGEEGQIYCGTCHLFHDPRVSEESYVTSRPRSGHPVAVAIRATTEARWAELQRTWEVESVGASFAGNSTPALQLPLEEDRLCRHCHGSIPR